MLPVPAPRQNTNDISGASSVTCFGWLRIALAAIATIQSMPPATCIVAAARITARMIRIASIGGEPGSSPKHEDQHGDADTAPDAERHTARLGAHDDRADDHEGLDREQQPVVVAAVVLLGLAPSPPGRPPSWWWSPPSWSSPRSWSVVGDRRRRGRSDPGFGAGRRGAREGGDASTSATTPSECGEPGSRPPRRSTTSAAAVPVCSSPSVRSSHGQLSPPESGHCGSIASSTVAAASAASAQVVLDQRRPGRVVRLVLHRLEGQHDVAGRRLQVVEAARRGDRRPSPRRRRDAVEVVLRRARRRRRRSATRGRRPGPRPGPRGSRRTRRTSTGPRCRRTRPGDDEASATQHASAPPGDVAAAFRRARP